MEGEGDAGGGGGDAAAAAAAAADKPFYEAFTREPLKTSPVIQKFKTAEDLADSYLNLEKRFGIDPARRIDLPADPNDKAAMRAVYQKLGLPEKPDGYGLALNDKATEADKAFLGRATGKMHELGLPAEMAKGMFELWNEEGRLANEAMAAKVAADRAAGTDTLKKEWGAAYEQRTREIGALLNKHGGPELTAVLGDPDKLADHARWAIFLGKLLDQMAEPGDAGARTGDAATGDRQMTPAQAKAAVATLEGDPVKGKALREASHPMHKAVVEERNRLLQMTAAKAA